MATPTREELRQLALRLAFAAPGLELLLTVATDHPPAARQAWKAWCDGHANDRMEVEGFELVPYVMSRLKDLEIEGRSVSVLEAVERSLWLESATLEAGARFVAKVMKRAGVSTVAVGGLGLRSLSLAECGPRALGGATLALPKSVDDAKFRGARRALEEAGFFVSAISPHASLARNGEMRVTLCRTVMKQDPRFDALEWAEPVEGEPFLALAPTAALLVSAASGLAEGGGALWPLDLVALIRTGEINWSAVEYHAETRGMTLLIEAALARACLVNESTSGGHADIHRVPDGVLTRLGSVRASHLEALELAWLMRGERRGAQAGRLLRELRERSAMVTPEGLKKHESIKGLAWDARWAKEWA